MGTSRNGNGEALKRVRARAWRFAHLVVPPVIRHRYHFTWEPVCLDGPFLLISNHAMNLDTVLIGHVVKNQPLSYVGSSHLMRLGLVTKLLTRYASLIPRSKASSSAGAVRAILTSLRQGSPVVLFAEGDCTWDGVSAKVFPATGNLAKAVRVPLVTYRLEGNYLSKPRWAKKPRRGRITGRIAHIYTPEQLDEMSAEEVTEAINRDIYVNVWDENGSVPFRSRKPAVGLERALFLCPACGEAGGLRTEGDTILCEKCGMRAGLDGNCRFREGRFSNIHEWDVWQRREMAKRVREGRGSGLFPGEGILTALDTGKSRKTRFSLELEKHAIQTDGQAFPFSGISDIAMVKTNRLLFSAPDGYYEIRSEKGILRPYLLAVQNDGKETENQ